MKTCVNCGCYIPDNWKQCPACGYSIYATPIKYKVPAQENYLPHCYKVVTLYEDERLANGTVFDSYENAFNYAARMVKFSHVHATQIVDLSTKKIIQVFQIGA